MRYELESLLAEFEIMVRLAGSVSFGNVNENLLVGDRR
jgi:hypothetical protein